MFLLMLACTGDTPDTADTSDTGGECLERELEVDGDLQAVVDGNTAFGLELYGQLAQDEGDVFLSPISVSAALGMTLAGAEGQTETEMATALELQLEESAWHQSFGALITDLGTDRGDCGYDLALANRLFGQAGYPWLDAFLQVAEQDYGAPLVEVDYVADAEAAREQINTWVEEQTQGLIEDLLKPGVIKDTTRLVLANAIYYRGLWHAQFDPDDTYAGTWETTGEAIELMSQVGTFELYEGGDYQALRLPYAGEEQAMIVLLPHEADGLAALEQQLAPELFETVRAGLSEQELDQLALPKFGLEYDASLVDALKAMGIADAFEYGVADFGGMADIAKTGEPLYITEVVHKAFIAVDEAGTEAAAATGVVVGTESAGPMFVADHPFLFWIEDELTGTVLFLGRVQQTPAPAG